MALANNSGAQFIFVSEEPGATTIDYLVDGIVEVVSVDVQDRTVREFIIHKLRGTEKITAAQVYLHAPGGKIHFLRTIYPSGLLEDEQIRSKAGHQRILFSWE